MTCPYTPGRVLGQGTFGRVILAQQGSNVYALKIITYPQYEINNLQEIDLLARMRHPNIIRASALVTGGQCPDIVNSDQMGLLLPLAQGDLEGGFGAMNFKQRFEIFFQLACAIKFLHDNNILHLDIKPANALLINGQAVISDLGLSRVVADVRKGFYLPGFVGTMVYSPPEVLSSNSAVFTDKTDVWALGMSFLVMLTANHPLLGARDLSGILMAIQNIFGNGQHRHILNYIRGIPEEFIAGTYHLLSGMLKVDPDERWSMAEVVNADIFRQVGMLNEISGRLGTPTVPAQVLTPGQIAGIRRAVDVVAQFGDAPVEAIFVALDFAARALVSNGNQEPSVLLIGGEVAGGMVLSLYNYAAPNNHGSNLLLYQQGLLINSAGIVRRNFIFEAANSLEQVEEIKNLITPNTIANYFAINPATFFDASIAPDNLASKDTVIKQTSYKGAWF